MAKLIGGVGTSHVPSIGAAFDRGATQDKDWKPFFDGYIPAQKWMADKKPDIAVVIFNDHGNSFFLDRVPTFAVGVAENYKPIDEGWGARKLPDFKGDVDFSWYFVDKLLENHFDPLVCSEIEVDHGLQVPMELLFGHPDAWPVKVLPIWVNTIQYPIPTPQRCWDMGILLRKVIESYPTDERIVVMGTGGLSHQLQGSRAGYINQEADLAYLEGIANDPEKYRNMSREEYVELFGSEGAELIMWLIMRGCMNPEVNLIDKHYHTPASMTGAGMVILENKD